MESTSRVAQAVRQALMMSAAISATGIAMPAFAQDVNEELEIVVTGSRIRSANLETTAPLTSVTSEDVTRQGVTRVEDLVNQLPQAFAAQNATVANGASGTATVNLRGLGSARTLVLVDGRRMPYGGVGQSAADLNQIPAQMVERVEVLTGGASAVYGSDALAGGGGKGRTIYGASDELGGSPKETPVPPQDLTATIYHALGLDPHTDMFDTLNRPFPLSRGEVIGEILS